MSWQQYKCYGPDEDYINEVSNPQRSCVIYDKTTNFKKLYQDSSVPPSCSNDLACYGADLINKPIYQNGSWWIADDVKAADGNAGFPIVCEKAYCSGGVVTNIYGNCNQIYGNDCYCSEDCVSAVGTTSFVGENCNGKDPGYVWGEQRTGFYKYWCPLTCIAEDCNEYIFDATHFVCRLTCMNDNHCSNTYYCDISGSVLGDCVVCNLVDHTQIGGSNGAWNCEEACGASSECDEYIRGHIFADGHRCDNKCQYVFP